MFNTEWVNRSLVGVQGKTSVCLEISFWCENNDPNDIEFSNVIWTLYKLDVSALWMWMVLVLCTQRWMLVYMRIIACNVVSALYLLCVANENVTQCWPMCAVARYVLVRVCLTTMWVREYIECYVPVLCWVLWLWHLTIVIIIIEMTIINRKQNRWNKMVAQCACVVKQQHINDAVVRAVCLNCVYTNSSHIDIGMVVMFSFLCAGQSCRRI